MVPPSVERTIHTPSGAWRWARVIRSRAACQRFSRAAGQALFSPGLTFSGRGKDRLVVQRGEGGDQDRPLGGFQHARVAVVHRRVDDHPRVAPGRRRRPNCDQFHAAEGADVCLAPAGIDQQQRPLRQRASVGQPW